MAIDSFKQDDSAYQGLIQNVIQPIKTSTVSNPQKNIIVSHASIESARRSRSKSLEKRGSNESEVKPL